MLSECCAPLGRSLLHAPTTRVASAAQMERGAQAKAQAKARRQGRLESVNFLLQFSLLPEPEGGLTRLAGEPPCVWEGGGVATRLYWLQRAGRGAVLVPVGQRRALQPAASSKASRLPGSREAAGPWPPPQPLCWESLGKGARFRGPSTCPGSKNIPGSLIEK